MFGSGIFFLFTITIIAIGIIQWILEKVLNYFK